MRLWKVIVRRIKKHPAPIDIYEESDMIIRTIRDIFTAEVSNIYIDEAAAYERAKEFLQLVMPRFVHRLHLYEGKEPLFHKYKLEAEINRIHDRKVPLSGGGSIVNIGSGCNKLAFPKLVAYTASKGGVEMLTKVSALELGPYGIRVNCVAPGATEIERTKLESANYAESWGGLAPLKRVGTPRDVGQTVVFLASDEASFVTGQTIWVDGGVFSQAPWIADRP